MTPTIRRRTLGALSGLSVLVAVAACGSADAASSDDDGAPSGTTQQDTTDDTSAGGTADDAAGSGSGEYADGDYSAEGSYDTPGGTESISVDLTVEGGTVTAVTVTPEASGGNAARFQDEFASGIADEVVGQDLSDLAVDKVSGSSLTGNGFNAALDEIRADAAA